LAAAARHFCGFGIEPAWASRVTGTSFLELSGNVPLSIVLWFIGCTRSRDETEKRDGERAER